MKQKEALTSEVSSLRVELQQAREDRDLNSSQVQTLSSELAKFKESTEKSCTELNTLTIKTNELEVGLQHFSFLQISLSLANICLYDMLSFLPRQNVLYKIAR